MKPLERLESAPAGRNRRDEAPNRGREVSTTSPDQKKAPKDPMRKGEQNQPNKVKVRTPPVADKQGSTSSRKGPPSRPAEENNNL